MEAFIRGLPKAELHVHIEGTLEPEMMFDFAWRNGVQLPFESVEQVRAAYEFTDLQSFLDIYYEGAAVLQTEPDHGSKESLVAKAARGFFILLPFSDRLPGAGRAHPRAHQLLPDDGLVGGRPAEDDGVFLRVRPG